MTALVYPDGLPCPLSTSLQRAERRLLSTLAGARQSRVASHDKVSTRQITFLLTSPAQCSAWLAWGASTLVNWAAWFSASWPTPEGGTTVQRFIGVPSYPQFQPSLNGWQVQATLQVRGRGVDPTKAASGFLFLNHFQSIRAGKVASAIGPDLAFIGTAALTNAQSKFGGNSGEVLLGTDEFDSATFSPVIPLSGLSWRFEGFFYETVSGTTHWFQLQGPPGFILNIGPTSNPSFDFSFDVNGTLSSEGGSIGNGTNKPVAGVWHHAGAQYDAVAGDFSIFVDGHATNTGLVATPGLFEGQGIDQIEVLLNEPAAAYASECALSAITPAQIYGTSYTVPTAPFAPLTP